jgi:hypothetical protein
MRARSLWNSTALSSALLAILLSGTLAHEQSATHDATRQAIQREYPDDPPGDPAKPLRGAVATPPVARSPFTIVQANVAPGGVNILFDAANEPSIAVDPNYPNRMCIGWRQFDTTASNFRQAGYAYSTDGGRTWTFPGVLTPGLFRSDPVLDFDAEGVFYYLSLRVEGNDFWCEMFKSWDHGKTWTQPAYAFSGDKEWMAIDRTGGIGHGHVYQAWSLAAGCCSDSTFNRSIDGGTFFSIPQVIPQNPVWGTMTVGPDGALYVAGVDPNTLEDFYCAKSTNAQNPAVTPSFDFVASVDLGGGIGAFAGSGSPNPGGLLGQVQIAVDHSTGPTAGNVYMLCSVIPPPAAFDPLDVNFVRSTDGGLTWSSPVRIHGDPTGWQWFGTMSVAPNGRIDVVWNDTRFHGQSKLSELNYSFSTDGGLTWSVPAQVSGTWDSTLGWPNQNKIGDYYDMVSDDVGAHLAWAATFNSEQDVYYTRINDYDCNSNGVGDATDISQGTSPDVNQNGIPDECETEPTDVPEVAGRSLRLHQNVPNPFNPQTLIRYDIPDGGSDVTLRVYDVGGRLVRSLVEGPQTEGAKSVTWNGRDDHGARVASGVYFYRLTAPGFEQTHKMVMLE